MTSVRVLTLCVGTLLAAASAATAQTSLFEQPAAGTGAAPAAAPAAGGGATPVAPKPKKPRGPVPARALTISNVSGSALTEFVVAADGKTAKLPRELGTNERTVMRLPAFRSCVVTLIATFERAGEAEQNEQDICKDRTVRLTNTGG